MMRAGLGIACLLMVLTLSGCASGGSRGVERTIGDVLEQGGMELILLTDHAEKMYLPVRDMPVTPVPMPRDSRKWRTGQSGYIDGRIVEARSKGAIARYFLKSGRVGFPVLISPSDIEKIDVYDTYRFYGSSAYRHVADKSPGMRYFLIYAAERR